MAAQHGRFHLHRGSEGLQFEWRFLFGGWNLRHLEVLNPIAEVLHEG